MMPADPGTAQAAPLGVADMLRNGYARVTPFTATTTRNSGLNWTTSAHASVRRAASVTVARATGAQASVRRPAGVTVETSISGQGRLVRHIRSRNKATQARGATRGCPLGEAAGGLGGPVSEDDASASPADRGECLHNYPAPVQPAVSRRGLGHRVFPAHLVRGHRHRHGGSDLMDDIQIGEGRLHHDDVSAFRHIEKHFPQRVAGLRILLIGRPVAEPGRAFGRVTERAVEGRGVFGRVRADGHVSMAAAIEGGPDRGHLAIHHAAGPDHVGARRRLGNGDLSVPLQGRVVVHLARLGEQSAVAVVGVFIQAQVRHEHRGPAHLSGQVGQGRCEDPRRVVGGRAAGVLDRRDAEEHEPTDARLHRLGGGLTQAVPGVLDDAWHGTHRLRLADSFLDEQRQHQVGRLDAGLGDEAPKRRGAAQPARPCCGKLGGHCGSWGYLSAGYLRRRRAPRRRSLGFRTGSPAATAASRMLAPYSASASTRAVAEGFVAVTSTRSPNSAAVRAVCGPITAITVTACGFPAMPIRFRTVDDEVNRTASKPPPLIASRIGAGGGAARTVRYAVTSSASQPSSVSLATSVSVAISARGSSTRLIGSRTSSKGGQTAARPSPDCSPSGMRSGLIPNSRRAPAVCSPTAATLTPANARASKPYSSSFSRTARTALTEVKATHW